MKTIVKNSPIHGKGLFSKGIIKNEELIGTFECIPSTKEGIYTLWIENKNEKLEPYEVINKMKYANHGENPNSILFERELFATRLIEKDEEIIFHYGSDWD